MRKAAADTLDKVTKEFESEVLAELMASKTETLAMIDSVRNETAEAVAKILVTGVKQAESVKRQIIGAAELEARNAQLRSLERAVSDAFDEAMKRIAAMSGAAHEKALAGLIQEGADVIGGRAQVLCASKDRKAVAAAIKRLEE